MLVWLLNVNTFKEVGMKKCMVDSLKKVHAIFHVDRGVKKGIRFKADHFLGIFFIGD